MSKPSRGICALCQGEFSKPAMTRHLEVCRQKVGIKEKTAPQPQKTSVFYIVIEGERLPMYWLHVEVAADTALAALDRFLRAIWLECCNHLSAFKIDDVHYCEDEGLFDYEGWHARKQPLEVTLEKVLRPGQIFTYEYDFGSTTELRLKVLAAHEVDMQGDALHILARNTLPPIPCDLCGKPATHVCRQCVSGDADEEDLCDGDVGLLEMQSQNISDDEDKGYLCSDCAEVHECAKEMLVRLRRVNSPRAGVCGYVGPTNPAYSEAR